jgi:predicted outer membrane protein
MQQSIRKPISTTPLILAIGVLGINTLATSADNHTEAEVHVIRNMSERQNTVNRFNKLAAEKASTELVRTIAKKDLEEHSKLFDELRALGKSTGIDNPGAGMPPSVSGPQGAGGPPPGPSQNQPQNQTPGQNQGQPPVQNGMQAGGPGPGGGGMGAGGPSGYADRYYAELEKLSGAAFDEKYLLRSLQYHEDMERTLNGELRNGVNPELLTWTKDHVKQYEQHATLIQRVLFGEVTRIDATQALGAEMRNDGPGDGPPPSKPSTTAAPQTK